MGVIWGGEVNCVSWEALELHIGGHMYRCQWLVMSHLHYPPWLSVLLDVPEFWDTDVNITSTNHCGYLIGLRIG